MSNSSPIILVVGGAGSGKDTVAEFIAGFVPNATIIAQADPMKRFGRDFFNLTEEQLWGPSDKRNAVDPRFASKEEALAVMGRISSSGKHWVQSVLPQLSAREHTHAFTDLVKWASATLQYGIDIRGLSARYILQTLGTEWGRNVYSNVWTEYAGKVAWKLLEGGQSYSRTSGLVESRSNTGLVVVTDGRFRNEVLNFRSQGAFILRLRSPKVVMLDAGVKNHQSETELLTLPDHWFNVELVNDKAAGLKRLELEVVSIIGEHIFSQHRTLVPLNKE